MANVNAPFGLSPVGTFSASPYTSRVSRYWIPSTDNNAYYIGDPVKSLANSDGNGIPGVIIANGTDTYRGVIAAIIPLVEGIPGSMASLATDPFVSLSQVSIPATKQHDYYVMVADDPEQMFMIQGDSTATNQIAANANKNFSLTITAPSPATNALSATVLSSASIATTQSLNMKLMGLAQIPGNGFGAFAKWICKINQHELMGNTAGI